MPRLKDLDPMWYGAGGDSVRDKDGNPVPERHGLGIIFDCPCGCAEKVGLAFRNPLDGGPPRADVKATWERFGDNFETLTLSPSILRRGGCGWHGWMRNGELVSC